MKNIFYTIVLLFSFISADAQTPVWVNNIGSTGNDEGRTIKIAPNGNVCVAGKFTGTMDLDPGVGVFNVTSAGFDDIYLACYTSTGAFIWGFSIGGNRYDAAWYMTIDESNNVIISGYFQSTGIDFDPGAGVTTLPFAGGTTLTYYGDGFVAKYSSTGVFQWAKGLGGPTVYDIALSLDTDPAGNVYVGGVFNTSMVVSGSITLTSITDGTAYLIKYDAAGTVIWAHNYGLAGIAGVDCFPRSLQVNAGFLYVAGFFQGTSNFNPWGSSTSLTASGVYDFYVAKYDIDGNFIFVRQIIGAGGTDNDEILSLSLDAADNIYVSGVTTSGTIIFDPGSPATSTVLTPGGGSNRDIVIAKFDNLGTYQWGKVIGGSGSDISYGIDVSSSNLFCTGQFSGTVDFDPSAAVDNLISAGLNDIFVAKYDLDGNYGCSFRVGSTGEDCGNGITHDAAGFMYTTGQFTGSAVDFDPSTGTLPLTTIGATDAYFGKYDPACLGAGTGICNIISLLDTIKLCEGEFITIPTIMTGTNTILSIAWTPPLGLSSTSILNPVLTSIASGYYYLTVRTLITGSLVSNGDFSAGNSGFSSSYTYTTPPSPVLLEGRYSVHTNPFGVHTGFTSMPDHTTGTGNMMIINGGSTPVDVWCQTITVLPNTDYDFSAWFANCSPIIPGTEPILQFRINGTLIGAPTTIAVPPGTWVNFSDTWNSGLSTSATICIYDAVTTAAGNDFAIDDITFRQICTLRDSVYLEVNIPDTTTSKWDTTICQSDMPLVLTAPAGHTSYLWNTGSTASSIGAAVAGTYWVTAITDCIVVSDTFIITANPNPVLYLGNDTSYCIGNTYILSVTQPAGTSYLWSTGSTADNIHISTSGSYTLTVTNSANCSATDIINVTVSPFPIVDLGTDTTSCEGAAVVLMSSVLYTSPTYLWHNTTTAPTYTASITGTYWLEVTENGCSGADTIYVEIKYDTFNLFSNDTAICRGQSVQVYANADPEVTIQWLPTSGIPVSNIANPFITPDTSAMYLMLVTIANCPDKRDSFYIDVQPNPDIFLGINRNVCEYDSLKIHSMVSPAWYTHYNYSWSPTLSIDDPTLPSVVFTADTTTNMILTVTTPAGCTDKDSLMLIVHPSNFGKINNDTAICPHDSIQLVASGGISYKWMPAMYLNSDKSATPIAHPVNSQTYTVLATSEYGCPDTLITTIIVHPAAVITLEDSTTIHPGESYQISPVTNGTAFSWTPAGGLSSKYISNPIATPQVNTRYILYTVTENGCRATDSIYIYVDDNELITMPNAFTPGSNSNNILYIIKRGLLSLNYFRIYNRWGNLVFESTDINAGWDGTYKGVPQPIGVFVYTIQAVSNKGKIINKAGNITLLR